MSEILINGLFTLGGALLGFLGAWWLQSKKNKTELQQGKELIDYANPDEKYARIILKSILTNQKFVMRSFEVLSDSIGGYTDEEIRKLLVSVGAKKGKLKDGREGWYLLERQGEL